MVPARIYKAEGIILKRKNVGEADRIITVFTKQYGKLRLIAKGIRRISSRRAAHLEIFSQVSLVVHHGKSLDSVSEVQPIAAFESLRQDLQRVGVAYVLCELVDMLTPEKQEHEDIYLILSHTLATLEQSSGKALYDKSKHFALELLWTLGFLPREKTLNGVSLQAFIENISEKQLKTPRLVRHLASLGF